MFQGTCCSDMCRLCINLNVEASLDTVPSRSRAFKVCMMKPTGSKSYLSLDNSDPLSRSQGSVTVLVPQLFDCESTEHLLFLLPSGCRERPVLFLCRFCFGLGWCRPQECVYRCSNYLTVHCPDVLILYCNFQGYYQTFVRLFLLTTLT